MVLSVRVDVVRSIFRGKMLHALNEHESSLLERPTEICIDFL